MAALAEPPPRCPSDLHLLGVHGHTGNRGTMDQQIEFAPGGLAPPRFDDNRAFQQRRG